jgi:hypothetical protein
MTAERRQALVGLAIITGSITLLFWWGLHFRIFGSRITFSLPQVGFLGWLMLGVFGSGYIGGGWRAGLKAAGGFALAICVAAGIGFGLGNYR